MHTLGYLPSERLILLPENYQSSHEFCFYLHDSIVSTLCQYEQSGAHNFIRDAIFEYINENDLEEKFENKNLLEILRKDKETDSYKLYKKHILGHLILALTSDMLHFLYEALTCFEKRKFSVGFSLLRKPFKENLFLLSWILADEDEFIRRFEGNNFKSFKLKDIEQRKNIIEMSISKLYSSQAFEKDLIWDLIYSKQSELGFESIWQRATHLTTSMGRLLKTEDYSFNFIFENADDDFYFEKLKNGLPYLFFYTAQVSLSCFNKVHNLNEVTINHLIISSYGIFESLADNDYKSNILELLQDTFDEFLVCLYCKQDYKITRSDLPQLFIRERYTCTKCKLENEFPLYWLIAQSKLNLV